MAFWIRRRELSTKEHEEEKQISALFFVLLRITILPLLVFPTRYVDNLFFESRTI
jgi:hypothetical protein